MARSLSVPRVVCGPYNRLTADLDRGYLSGSGPATSPRRTGSIIPLLGFGVGGLAELRPSHGIGAQEQLM